MSRQLEASYLSPSVFRTRHFGNVRFLFCFRRESVWHYKWTHSTSCTPESERITAKPVKINQFKDKLRCFQNFPFNLWIYNCLFMSLFIHKDEFLWDHGQFFHNDWNAIYLRKWSPSVDASSFVLTSCLKFWCSSVWMNPRRRFSLVCKFRRSLDKSWILLLHIRYRNITHDLLQTTISRVTLARSHCHQIDYSCLRKGLGLFTRGSIVQWKMLRFQSVV